MHEADHEAIMMRPWQLSQEPVHVGATLELNAFFALQGPQQTH